MSEADPAGGPDLPAALVMRLEQACDRFEAAYRAGLRPPIGDAGPRSGADRPEMEWLWLVRAHH
jgi:hypothetical protein